MGLRHGWIQGLGWHLSLRPSPSACPLPHGGLSHRCCLVARELPGMLRYVPQVGVREGRDAPLGACPPASGSSPDGPSRVGHSGRGMQSVGRLPPDHGARRRGCRLGPSRGAERPRAAPTRRREGRRADGHACSCGPAPPSLRPALCPEAGPHAPARWPPPSGWTWPGGALGDRELAPEGWLPPSAEGPLSSPRGHGYILSPGLLELPSRPPPSPGASLSGPGLPLLPRLCRPRRGPPGIARWDCARISCSLAPRGMPRGNAIPAPATLPHQPWPGRPHPPHLGETDTFWGLTVAGGAHALPDPELHTYEW